MGTDRRACLALDEIDELAWVRDEFELPPGLIYLDGNSLGPLPRRVRRRVEQVVTEEWGQGLIRSWNDAEWFDAPMRVGRKMAPLIGAKPHEVVVVDSTSLNLFKVVAAAARLTPGRPVILSETGNFPTDLYIADGVAELYGREVRVVESTAVVDSLDSDVGVVMLTHVDYRTGAYHDIDRVTAAIHDAGALAVWDLAHTAGAMPVDLGAAGADFAVGCGYKYLCGGPGAPSFLYVAERWHDRAAQPITGWHGHARPFEFTRHYEPAAGVERFRIGTPALLSLLAFEAALELFEEVDMADLRAKSMQLTQLFADLVAERLPGSGLELASPADPADRGGQVSFRHPDAYPLVQALIARGVVGDFRAPDIARFGMAPLHLRYVDMWDAVEHLVAVVDGEEWRRPEFSQRGTVT